MSLQSYRETQKITRRRFLQDTASISLLLGLDSILPAYARHNIGLKSFDENSELIDLRIHETTIEIAKRNAAAVTVNGSIPGPVVRLREGRNATIQVANRLKEDTSIHWHGILLPPHMDGVPGVSFAGIKPGETFTYRFPVKQNGTYWYHSHSGMQEQLGHYGPLIIDPAEPEPFKYDREYVVMLSDWSFEDPHKILARLKKQSSYYNTQRLTMQDFFRDVSEKGWSATMADRLAWNRMRMDPTDIADVTGSTYLFLVNGMAPVSNWTGLFSPGERIRLRFINAATMSYFDVRIPGLKMTVVQADGQNVQPVSVDEFRIAVAETYDVIVEPEEDKAYTVFAEAMDRSGYARGTLAPRPGMTAPIPARRPRPVRTMADMGMDHGSMGDMSSMKMDMTDMDMSAGHSGHGMMHGMEGMKMQTGSMGHSLKKVKHGPDRHGPGAAAVAMMPRSRLDEPGNGLENTRSRVLVYSDLRSLSPGLDQRKPEREIELHLTGNMERYMWSFDGKKFSEVDGPISFYDGERLRFTLVNDTMMDHPIHLHGMWMELDNGAGRYKPRKHTINVKPGERVSADISVDALGDWALHCHLLFHRDAGMFRVVSVTQRVGGQA